VAPSDPRQLHAVMARTPFPEEQLNEAHRTIMLEGEQKFMAGVRVCSKAVRAYRIS
jgi:hypothetical protein